MTPPLPLITHTVSVVENPVPVIVTDVPGLPDEGARPIEACVACTGGRRSNGLYGV